MYDRGLCSVVYSTAYSMFEGRKTLSLTYAANEKSPDILGNADAPRM
jgi:hypothetical protein